MKYKVSGLNKYLVVFLFFSIIGGPSYTLSVKRIFQVHIYCVAIINALL
jgi:hypothetical protein